MKMSRWILLRLRNVSNKRVGKIKTHILCLCFFPPKNRAFYEIMSKNMETWRTQTIWRIRVACWISKAARKKAHARTRASTTTRTHTTPTRMHARTQKYVKLLFHGNRGFVNEPQVYVTLTSLAMLNAWSFLFIEGKSSPFVSRANITFMR